MSPFLSDADLIDATHRIQPSAQARALARIGVPFRRRPDGTLLVSRAALDDVLRGTMPKQGPANGLTWSKQA